MKLFSILLLLTFLQSNVCHESKARIFGGSEAPIGVFPWMVSIRYDAFNTLIHLCGGAIVSDSFVLTAASCVQQAVVFNSLFSFSINAGIHSVINGNETTGQLRRISQAILHPNYSSENNLNNIALVRVSPAFNIKTPSVATISLSNLTSLENMDLTTVGWGLMTNRTNSTGPTIFLQQIIIQENVQCSENVVIHPDTQLCATGTCQADSGGPLMIYSNDIQQYELVGITSFRDSCAIEGVYTRIAPFVKWILTTLENPPPLPTLPPIPTLAPITFPTPKPDVLGPPIPFICNTSYSCGCSPIPVIFHDEPPFPPIYRRVQGRIVGGENAEPHSWPWTVSLRSFNRHFCGGTLLNEEWVLTAAHCLTSSSITVHIGVHNETSPSPQIRDIEQFIVHPNYEPPPRYVNDIALIHLSAPVDTIVPKNYAGLACLPSKTAGVDYPKVNTSLAVIGWGRLLSNGARPQVLRQVRVKAIANNDIRCLNSINDKERQFCAMVDGGEKDSCQGDSGGPIHQWIDNHWEQVGLVSYGRGCAEAQNPGVYTRLSFYHDWIYSNINGINQTTSEPNRTTMSEPTRTTTTEPNMPTVSGPNRTTMSGPTRTTTTEPNTTTTTEPTRTTTGEPNRTTTSESNTMPTTPCTGECPPGDHGAANMIETNVFLGLIFHLFLLFALLH